MPPTNLTPHAACFNEPFLPNPSRQRRGAVRSALMLVVAILAAQVLLASPAQAQMPDCKTPPAPEYPGLGFSGSIDDPSLAKGTPNSVYYEYSYGGQVWHTYDTGCLGNPAAATDTWFGNELFNVGKGFVAITNQLHWMQRDDGMLKPVDDLVTTLSADLYTHAYLPWLALALLLATVVLLWRTLQGRLAHVGKRSLYVLAGLWFASATFLTPTLYTHMVDDFLIGGVGEIQTHMLNAGSEGNNPRTALPTLLHEQVVYQNWLKGEFGTAEAPEAQQYGRQLLAAQSCTKVEILGNTCDANAKKQQFTEIAGKLENTPAYPTFTGNGSRLGHGISAALEGFCYTIFQLVCLLALFLAKLILRVVVLCGPILGLVSIVYNPILPRIFHTLGTVIGHGAVLAVASIVHLRILMGLLSPAAANWLGLTGQMVVAVLVTAIMWLMLRPFRKLRSMMTASAGMVGVQTLPWEHVMQKRFLRKLRRHMRHPDTPSETDESPTPRGQHPAAPAAPTATARPETVDEPVPTPITVAASRVHDPPHHSRTGAIAAGTSRVEPDNAPPPTSTLEASRTTGPAQRTVAPTEILPATSRSDPDREETPENTATSKRRSFYRDHGSRQVWRLYRASSGRVENVSDNDLPSSPSPRPENREE